MIPGPAAPKSRSRPKKNPRLTDLEFAGIVWGYSEVGRSRRFLGHCRDSLGTLWGWAPQGFFLGTRGLGWALQGFFGDSLGLSALLSKVGS